MVNEREFRQWLTETKGFKQKSAGDILSRCRRVERVLGISLREELSQPADVEDIRQKLRQNQAAYLDPKTNPIYAVAVLQRAVNLYGEYLRS